MLSSSGQTQADGQPGEGDDNEDDEAKMVCRFGVVTLLFCKVNNRAAEHDQVQNYNDMEVSSSLPSVICFDPCLAPARVLFLQVLTWMRNFFKESKLLDQVALLHDVGFAHQSMLC